MKLRHALLISAALATATGLATAQEQTAGQVRKVDPAAGKITIEHGEITNLDMPPMTMTFQVKAGADVSGLKPGDRVLFTADKVGNTYTVTSIRKP